jgi:hypothetical protein
METITILTTPRFETAYEFARNRYAPGDWLWAVTPKIGQAWGREIVKTTGRAVEVYDLRPVVSGIPPRGKIKYVLDKVYL